MDINYSKVPQSRMAALFGVDRSTVKEVADLAGLSPPYSLVEFAKAYCDKLRVAAAGRDQTTKERLDLVEEQARLACAKADDQEMKNSLARKELVAAEDVVAIFAPFGREIRQRLLSLGSTIGPKVGKTVTEQRRIKAAIDSETLKALKALSDYEDE